MTSFVPLLAPLSKKERGKSKKYITLDEVHDGIRPYRSLGKVQSRKKKARKDRSGGDDSSTVKDPKLYHQYEEALRRRDFRQVLWMITNGDIPANYETKTGETAILAAVSAKNLDALSILMTSGVSINTSSRKGYTPLMKAIAVAVPQHKPKKGGVSVLPNNNVEEFEHLSATVNDINTGIYDNDIVASVLGYEPNLIQTDQSGRTAFDWAKLTGNTQALEWLEKRQREKSILHQSHANRQERESQCEEILRRHDEYIQRIESLIAPQFFDEIELVKFLKTATITSTEFSSSLIDLKVVKETSMPLPFRSQYFVNVETREGWTPLSKCAAFGYVAGVQELLAMGADLHYETRLRHSAMTWASYCGHEAVVLHFLRIGVDVNQKTRDGKTALMHAISNSQVKIVHHLLVAMRDQCFPAKPIETFSSEVNLNSLPQSKVKFRISGNKSKELKPIETEWHNIFLKQIRRQDQTGKDALKLAQYAVEQAQLRYSEFQGDSTSACDEEFPPAIQVFRQVQTAINEAEEHKRYVELHAERTKLTTCHNDGCSFKAPKDVLPTHEHHHCTKRTVKCDNCDTSLIFEDRSLHDIQLCSMRRVECPNFQYGCQEQMLFQNREHHLSHQCRKRAMECRLSCGATVLFDELDEHESARCPLRIVTCDLGCQATFTANFGKPHRLHECPKRMIPCRRKSSMIGGCGILVKFDEMEFHLSTLCELRELSCMWAKYGCEERIAGAAAARYNHETNECPFRMVSCRNGCELSGHILACFAEDHYRWQCMLEQKECPNQCHEGSTAEVLQLPRHLYAVHCLQDAGDCPLRKTHCPLDLCGKHIRLLDSEQEHFGPLMSSDTKLAKQDKRTTSLRALQQRVSMYDEYLAELNNSRCTEEHRENVELIPNLLEKPKTKAFLVDWLGNLYAQLQLEYTEHKRQKDSSSLVCRALTFDPAKSQHLIEFPDGHSLWMSLGLREYDAILPPDANFQYFRCGLLTAQALGAHIEERCCHRLVSCPLSCGQRFSEHAVEFHVSQRCNMRNAVCRLGCGEVMAFALLAEHETDHCKFRSVFCEHCHFSLPVGSMQVHLDKECQQRPRGCRLGCSSKVAWAATSEHESSQCPKRMVRCAICDGEIWYCERDNHEKNECSLRIYGTCDEGCGVTLRHNEIAHHLLFSCTKRMVDCKQCKQQMKFASLQRHNELLCPKRIVNCGKGCGMRLMEMDTERHETEECKKRPQFCENQCGLYVPSCEMEDHLKLTCSMRVMECPIGCREWIFAYLYEDHCKRCRQRVVPCGVGGKLCARPIRVWHTGNKLVRCAVHGESALFWALKSEDLELVTYLLQNVDAFNVVNEEFANGFSPLVLAASLGNVDLIQLLFRFGADVNFETSRGRTPLSEACMAQDPVIVKLLIDNRASVLHTNRQGRNLLQMVYAFAESEISTGLSTGKEPTSESKWKEVIHLLEEQVELERAQRDLFIAIACSNYDHLIQCFKNSGKAPTHTLHIANPLEALQELVNAKVKKAEEVRAELDDAIQVFNESIAETETKRVEAIHLSSQVDDSCRRLQNVDKAEEASDIDSSALEADMIAMIREITAQDIAQLLNSHVPSETELVVVKALLLLCGAVPRGRRNATEYTDVEWWKTAQALLMDRSLLRRLRGYRQQTISPEVMSKVRRECLKNPAFAACSASFKESRDGFDAKTESGERSLNSRIPPADTLRGNIVGILATWVQGVEIEYKARAERQVLVERKRQLESVLTVTREKQQHANFEAQVEARSLPARQEEVEAVRVQSYTAEKELEVAKKRLNTYKLLNYASLSGHTPLTFACAVGNDAIVHMLLSHGACSGHQFEEQTLCASFIQVLVRDYQYRRRFERERRQQELSGGSFRPRSDAAIEALVRNVAHAFIVGHYKRKLVHYRQTHRIPLHEAIFNGYPEIAAVLLSKEAKLWQNTYVLPERVYPGSLLENIAPISKELQEMIKRKGKWKLQPLATEQKKPQGSADEIDFGKPMTVADTLNCALKYYDSRLFKASKGWEASDVTFYSATAEFVNNSLAKMETTRNRWQNELVNRRSIMRKNAELKAKHTALEAAIISRDFIAISSLLDNGAFADYETSGGAQSALMAACIGELYVQNEDGKDVLAVEYLLDRTTNRPLVNFESSHGVTPLGTAAFYGTLKCAQVLIERGASINLAARLNGRTALMIAADNGKEGFVRFLLAYKEIDVFLRDTKGKTALDYAKRRGFVDITGILEAAMGGKRDRVVSTVSGLYGVCKWGCGFMTPFEGHLVHQARIVKNTNPLEEHELHHCPKRHVRCPNNCGIGELWAEDVKTHIKHACVLRLVHCPNQKCNVRYPFRDRTIHLHDQCEFRMVACDCGESMSFQRHVMHAKTQCPMRLVPCPLQCTLPAKANDNNDGEIQVFQLRSHDVKAHVTGSCPHRSVRCRNGCTINDLLLKKRTHHETIVCLLRRVECKWGCKETVFANTQALHERDECELRQQSCPNRCGRINIPVLQTDEHVSTTCTRRLMVCSLGCGRRVPLHMMDAHVSLECRKRIVTCGQCQKSLLEEERTNHQNSQCSNRLTVCGLCGQTDLLQTKMPKHRKEECKMRQVTCKYQCFMKLLLAHEKERHEMWECAYRPIWCPLGCGEVFISNTIKKHQRSCPMRFVVCGNGCGEELREKDRTDHEQHYCSLSRTSVSRKGYEK